MYDLCPHVMHVICLIVCIQFSSFLGNVCLCLILCYVLSCRVVSCITAHSQNTMKWNMEWKSVVIVIDESDDDDDNGWTGFI